MTAPEDPEIDPQPDAESIGGAPETAQEAARARDLAELFGPLTAEEEPLSEVDDAASREQLAALFARPTTVPAAATDAEADVTREPEPVFSAEPRSAWAAAPEVAAEAETMPDAVAGHRADLVSPERPSAAEPVEDASTSEVVASDPLAWLDRVDERPVDTPEKAALGTWLGTAGSPNASATPASVAAAALAQQTQVMPAVDVPGGSFSPAGRPGIRGWSSRVWWSVAVSIVLLVGVVVGSVVIAQTISANNLAAQELAAAVDDLEAAEESATQPQSALDEAVGQYDDTLETARATAESAGPPLAAIAGMAGQPLLDASNTALAALIAQIATSPAGDLPKLYERGDVDLNDIDAVTAATQTAEKHAQLVTTATREVGAAQTALQEKLDALRTAQVALGASLPETAVLIVGENRRALQSFRDAVVAASVAVPAAQNAGGSGDAEILAYASAVTALRNDQTRAITDVTPPSVTTPSPTPAPDPVPAPDPAPQPDPVPQPEPSQTTDPPVVP